MKLSLKWQLTIPIMLWSFLSLVIINVLTIWELRADHLQQSEANRMNQVKLHAEQFNHLFSMRTQSVEIYGRLISELYLAESKPNSKVDKVEKIDKLTRFMVERRDPNIYGYWFVSESAYMNQGPFDFWYGIKNGNLMNFPDSSLQDPSLESNRDNPSYHYYWGPKNAGKTTVSEVYRDQTIQEDLISISTPIYNNNHDLIGVAGMDINWIRIQTLLNNIQLNENGYTLLITTKGNLLSPSYPFVNDMDNIINKTDSDFQAIYSELKETTELVQKVDFRGKKTYFFSFSLENSGWKIISIIPEKELARGYYSTVKMNLYLNTLLLFFCFFLNVWWINRKTVYPLNQMLAGTNKTLQGNYNHQLEIKVNNEIKGLAVAINQMTHKLSQNTDLEDKLKRISSLHMVGEMAASISHEIRNPLTTIRGFLQILRNKNEYQADRVYFDTMIEEVTRANNIITEYLSLAQDKFTELSPQNLNTIIQTIYPLMQASANANNQSIYLNLEEIPPIHLDEKEIRQLLHNLIRNGLEAMSEGQLLTLRTYESSEHVILSIQDQGSGIPPEIIKQLGTPFMTTKESGTGLGLTVCYNIAKRHNATIQVDSGPTGTTFNIQFPKYKDNSSL
jgi:two-component system, sporulation sensor kinase E